MPKNYLSEIEREDGTVLTIKDAEARAAIDDMDPTLQQILSGVNDIKNGIGDTKSIIDAILSGEAPVPQVRFLDYDGTVVQTYTAKEFAALTELPENPTHEGLTAQGWNWSLSDAKTHVAVYGSLNIGQQYVTNDGKTRIYINLPEGRTSPVLRMYLNANSELDIDWGDGSTHSTWTTTSDAFKSERHNYPDNGEYVIAITVVSGSFILQSQQTSYNTFFTDGKNNNTSSDRAYLNSIQKIEIGTGVTSIGQYAFYNCSSLSSITIPSSVTTIGITAFYYCYALSSVTIPDDVTTIGEYTFYYCSSLSSITIPGSVITIGKNAFQSCFSLSSITIPSSVTTIGAYAFSNCYSLSSITIPSSVTTIGGQAFQHCYSLSSITIPDDVTTIGSSTFYYCYALSSVTIPNSVTTIGVSAFAYCYSLSSITIPSSVTTIQSSAFQNCYSLSSITIPADVTTIGNGAFSGCVSLSSVTIPDDVTTIGDNVFNGCVSLSSVTISDDVTTIGGQAFQNCYSLSSITIPSSVTTIGNSAFSGCVSLSSITIPSSVTSIGQYAFSGCVSLSSVTIPDDVTTIQSSAFQNCYSLSSITIPNSVTSINQQAFAGCNSMDYIKFIPVTPPTVPNSNAWSAVSTSAVIYVPALTSNLYMNGTNYPAKTSYNYIGYATYASGETLPTLTTDETHTLTWYATSADAIAQTNPITEGNGNEVYSRATPVT